jgi:hypothetical protein
MERAKLHPVTIQADSAVSSEEKQFLTTAPPPPPATLHNAASKKISLYQLINKLNHLNFIENPLIVNFCHKQYPRTLSIKAESQPCQDEHLICRWRQDAGSIVNHPDVYDFKNIIVPDGKRFLVVEPQVAAIGEETIQFVLPETCDSVEARKTRRHRCQDIHVYVTQNGALYYGSMIDFSAFSFRVQVNTALPQTFDWVNAKLPVYVILFNGNKTLYSGECKITKRTHGHKNQEWVLVSAKRQIIRFRPKEYRSTRQKILPLPTISFTHPLSGEQTRLEGMDVSGTGLAVREDRMYAVLMPGLIIPDLRICIGEGSHVTCTAQVVYSQSIENSKEPGMLRCGLAILDMAADEHVKVLSLIQQADNENAYLCNRVNLDELWDFFFETGFIYPDKYEYIEKNKAHIKQIYKKLYTETPQVARHFIYQRNGRILAHMAWCVFTKKRG